MAACIGYVRLPCLHFYFLIIRAGAGPAADALPPVESLDYRVEVVGSILNGDAQIIHNEPVDIIYCGI